jgi:dTDP-glucose 4,6-dehydratase
LPIYGDGLNVRDWIFVDDHCDAISKVLDLGKPGTVYNIGGNAERTNLEVVRKICETVDSLVPGLPHAPVSNLITFVPDRPGHDRRYAIDVSKIERELSWRPNHEFETAIQETVQWYLDNTTWVQRVTDGTYARERLGKAKT